MFLCLDMNTSLNLLCAKHVWFLNIGFTVQPFVEISPHIHEKRRMFLHCDNNRQTSRHLHAPNWTLDMHPSSHSLIHSHILSPPPLYTGMHRWNRRLKETLNVRQWERRAKIIMVFTSELGDQWRTHDVTNTTIASDPLTRIKWRGIFNYQQIKPLWYVISLATHHGWWDGEIS